MKFKKSGSSEPVVMTFANNLFPKQEKMKISTIIKPPTFKNAGIVCRNELNIMYNLLAFLSNLRTLQTRKILKIVSLESHG